MIYKNENGKMIPINDSIGVFNYDVHQAEEDEDTAYPMAFRDNENIGYCITHTKETLESINQTNINELTAYAHNIQVFKDKEHLGMYISMLKNLYEEME